MCFETGLTPSRALPKYFERPEGNAESRAEHCIVKRFHELFCVLGRRVGQRVERFSEEEKSRSV